MISHEFLIYIDDKIVVATTRLETMLGDTGIAVHPSDERYKVRGDDSLRLLSILFPLFQ